MPGSIELLRNTINEWSLVHGRKQVTDAEFDVWLRIFSRTNSEVLGRALGYVTQNAERMPTPGTLTKAIARAKEEMQVGERPRLLHRVGHDKNSIPCLYWSDEPNAPAYKATNCPEGRNFLATLAHVAGISADRAAQLMENWSA